MLVNLKKKLILSCLISILSLSVVSCSTKKKDPYEGLSAKDIYLKGRENIEQGKLRDAIKDFEALGANYPYGNYVDKAKLSLIHVYYTKKEYLQAKATAERFIRVYPNHQHVDYAYYMQGLAEYEQYYSMIYKYFKIDRSKRDPAFAIQAFDDFKILLKKFPTSKYAQDARKRMIHLRNQIALHELDICKYYMKKAAYLAAINRAQFIISDFDQTPVVQEALQIMVAGYKALGMSELERNVTNLLNANFTSITSNSATEK